MDGMIVGYIHCPRCNTVRKATFQSSAVWSGECATIGDEIIGCDEFALRPGAREQDNAFLETYACSGCGTGWVLATMRDGRLASLEGVSIEDGIAKADFASWGVFEEFKDATKVRDHEPASWPIALVTRAIGQHPLGRWPWRIEPLSTEPRRLRIIADDLAEAALSDPLISAA